MSHSAMKRSGRDDFFDTGVLVLAKAATCHQNRPAVNATISCRYSDGARLSLSVVQRHKNSVPDPSARYYVQKIDQEHD